MKVHVLNDRCQGHGVCNMTSPEIFHLAVEDGHCFVLSEEVPPGLESSAEEGADACPELAIVITH